MNCIYMYCVTTQKTQENIGLISEQEKPHERLTCELKSTIFFIDNFFIGIRGENSKTLVYFGSAYPNVFFFFEKK